MILQGLLFLTAWSHSWVACTDYRGPITGRSSDYSDDFCKGYGRNWNGNNLGGGIDRFANDRGYDYQPRKGRTCRDSKQDAVPYSVTFPMTQYIEGQTYNIVWPAKNHARTRDFGLSLFACCGDDCSPSMEDNIDTFTSNAATVASFPSNRNGQALGFGNCDDVSSSDDAVCSQRIQIPKLLHPGQDAALCTFVWYWPFNNKNDVYTTCYEVQLFASDDDVPPATAPSPTPNPTAASCIREGIPLQAWQQCGGVDVFGDTMLRCCVEGYTCSFQNDYYSQCVPSASVPLPDPTTTAPTTGTSTPSSETNSDDTYIPLKLKRETAYIIGAGVLGFSVCACSIGVYMYRKRYRALQIRHQFRV